MQMRPPRIATVAGQTDHLPPLDYLPEGDPRTVCGQMSVHAERPVRVEDEHFVGQDRLRRLPLRIIRVLLNYTHHHAASGRRNF